MTATTLTEVFSAATPALQQAVEMAGDPAATADERLAAANDCAETLAELWPCLESAGEPVVELLVLLDMAVSALPERVAAGDAAAVVPILELIALLDAHFQTPDDLEVIEALVEMATSDAFDPPLERETADRWLRSLEVGMAAFGAAAVPAECEGAADETERFQLMAASEPPMAVPDAAETVCPDETTPLPCHQLPSAGYGEEAKGLSEGAHSSPLGERGGEGDGYPPSDQHPEVSDEAAELLELLATALEDSNAELIQRIDEIASAPQSEVRANAALSVQEILVCLADAASQAGLLGFSTVCAGLGYQIAAVPAASTWPEPLIDRLVQFPGRLQRYLFDPLADATRLDLVDLLCDPAWPEPWSEINAKVLLTQLYRDPQTLEPDPEPARAIEIQPEDLSLDPAAEIDGTSVLASFRREGPELAHQLADALQRVVAGGGEDWLRRAQRCAHTLKGSANVCGVRAVAVLGHHLEDLLEFLIHQGITPGAALADSLLAAADALALMLDVVAGRERSDPDALRPTMQEVLDWANRIDREGAAALAADVSASTLAASDLERASLSEPADTEPPAPSAEDEEVYLQVPARAIDDLLRLVGELSMALAQSEQTLDGARRTLREISGLDRGNLLQIAELEKLVDLRGLGSRGVGRGLTAVPERFDPLELEQYNEMYTATRRLNEGVTDARELAHGLDGALRDLDELGQRQLKLTQQLRHLALGTRLVPASSVEARLTRAVRQTCRATGKTAELQLHGREVLIDGDLLDRLMPAMMHMVRNAIDHGIEPPEAREAAGKPRTGRLEVHFRQAGSQIEVEVGDDGQGLDLERVRAKAIAKGLIEAGSPTTDRDLALLTLRPGFSTRDQVTQVSGRGVGMDVVASAIRALNGSFAIDTHPGQGYRFSARLPASLLAIYCLLVRCGEELAAIPANEVGQAVLAEPDQIQEMGGGWCFSHADHRYPLTSLGRLMGLPASDPSQGRRVVLLVGSGMETQAVMVDALIESRELVVMKLGALVPRVPGLLSASLLGDGRVVPIVDPRILMRVAAGAERVGPAPESAPSEAAWLPTALIVDDSISMRRILSRLVEDAGLRALTARDGMEAIQVLGREVVDLLLVDMEMPQMNGLELTAHLRAQPASAALPIAMITSRSTEKHRREAQRAGVDAYFVKPYREDEVLDFIHRSLLSRAQVDR